MKTEVSIPIIFSFKSVSKFHSFILSISKGGPKTLSEFLIVLFTIQDNNLDSYVEKIHEIFNAKDTKRLCDFLSNAKKEVIEKYSESRIVRETLKIYQSFD